MTHSKFIISLTLSLFLFSGLSGFTTSIASANSLKKMSPADRAIEDLNFPNRPKYSNPDTNAELISNVKTALATLIAAQEFEGSRCDLKTPEMLFPSSTEVDASTVLATAESTTRSQKTLQKTKEFRVSVKSRSMEKFNTSTFVRTNAELTQVLSYTTATCAGTRTLGLQYDCYVTAYCKAKAPTQTESLTTEAQP